MPYRHTATRIHEIVQAPKVLAAGQSVEPKKHGSHGMSFGAFVELAEGSFLDTCQRPITG
jgi:hypothetical protein